MTELNTSDIKTLHRENKNEKRLASRLHNT